KMHTSRRDAFRSINTLPYAQVDIKGNVTPLRFYPVKNPAAKLELWNAFEKRVALVKIHPGFSYRQLEFYEQEGYRGIVLEATALGHLPINTTDDYTKDHELLLVVVKRMVEHGIVVVIASQCPYGVVDLNVYRPGRKLLEAGVIPALMTAETAFVKLGWVLSKYNNRDEVRTAMMQNIAGEIPERIDPRAFLN
ncbi:MAG: Glu-tRNA(Gln) amidotransferase GatDE subunit D, partial [Candidatus Aenigmarchaeota archaeon]|nr:Glu-tRNA(Gln) amidotransferase GatDE subunit D [Candidatus Aenigmarchaeota archaeon]